MGVGKSGGGGDAGSMLAGFNGRMNASSFLVEGMRRRVLTAYKLFVLYEVDVPVEGMRRPVLKAYDLVVLKKVIGR